MEKLIELLNEWQQSFNPWYEFTYKYSEESAREDLNKLSQLKRFVKRLVDNDKIDKRKVFDGERKTCWELVEKDIDDFLDEVNLRERLLMLLAISKNPIEDLISYLK